jgi:hypothetical protein
VLPVEIVPEAVLEVVPVPDLAEGVLVVINVPPFPSVLVTTTGAPEMLPALAAPLNSLTLTSKLAKLFEYCVGIELSHAGVDISVRAELRIDATSVPVILAADAAEAMAG